MFFECYHPDHPMTRTESKRARAELMRYVAGTGIVGAEDGMDFAAPWAHYYEGMMSLQPFRVPDAGRAMQTIWTTVPPLVETFQVGPQYRIPLWELVYHDCVVAYWYWGDYNNKLPALWARRDLFNVLYGTPPMYLFDRAHWEANRARFAASYARVAPVARGVGYTEMTGYRWLTDSGTVQQTEFDNGTIVTVNFGADLFRLADGTAIGPLDFHVGTPPKPLRSPLAPENAGR
jgi:hypothetical protein